MAANSIYLTTIVLGIAVFRDSDSMIRAISFGGGVQSTALLVLASQGKIDFRTFLFANVGDDSEHPATLRK